MNNRNLVQEYLPMSSIEHSLSILVRDSGNLAHDIACKEDKTFFLFHILYTEQPSGNTEYGTCCTVYEKSDQYLVIFRSIPPNKVEILLRPSAVGNQIPSSHNESLHSSFVRYRPESCLENRHRHLLTTIQLGIPPLSE